MKMFDLPEDFKIVEAANHWSNGQIVSSFRAFGVVFRVSRSDGTSDKDGFYTYLRIADDGEYRGQKVPDWLQRDNGHGLHFPTLPGTVEPDQAAAIIGVMKAAFDRGKEQGCQLAQRAFRKAIGLTI